MTLFLPTPLFFSWTPPHPPRSDLTHRSPINTFSCHPPSPSSPSAWSTFSASSNSLPSLKHHYILMASRRPPPPKSHPVSAGCCSLALKWTPRLVTEENMVPRPHFVLSRALRHTPDRRPTKLPNSFLNCIPNVGCKNVNNATYLSPRPSVGVAAAPISCLFVCCLTAST